MPTQRFFELYVPESYSFTLWIFPDPEQTDVRPTITHMVEDADDSVTITKGHASNTVTEVESIHDVVEITQVEYEARLDDYFTNDDMSRIGSGKDEPMATGFLSKGSLTIYQGITTITYSGGQ